MAVFNLKLDDIAIANYRASNGCAILDDDSEERGRTPFDTQPIHRSESSFVAAQSHVALVVLGNFESMPPAAIARLHRIVRVVTHHIADLALIGIRWSDRQAELIWQGTAQSRWALVSLLTQQPEPFRFASISQDGVIGGWQGIDADRLRDWLIAEIKRKGGAGCDLTGIELCDADLSGANLANATLSEANLQGVNFSGANLNGATLNLARLMNADLSSASLVGAKLIGAKAIGANLGDADLSNANLSNANFSGANLARTKLEKTKMTAARFVYSRGLSMAEQIHLRKHRGAIF
jgi:uncharacterized protein YjbI with pentapeptide repeats